MSQKAKILLAILAGILLTALWVRKGKKTSGASQTPGVSLRSSSSSSFSPSSDSSVLLSSSAQPVEEQTSAPDPESSAASSSLQTMKQKDYKAYLEFKRQQRGEQDTAHDHETRQAEARERVRTELKDFLRNNPPIEESTETEEPER